MKERKVSKDEITRKKTTMKFFIYGFKENLDVLIERKPTGNY